MAWARDELSSVEQPRTEVAWRHSRAGRARQRRFRRRRRRFIVVAVVALVVLGFAIRGAIGTTNQYALPSASTLADLSLRQRIVAIGDSQVGYSTQPADSYCNKFSAYWDAGTSNCPSGETSEEWCADFAAWVWRIAGVHFVYGYSRTRSTAPLRASTSGAFANGLWHPLSSGYAASPGDIAIYGLSHGANPSAVHAAIVTSDTPGSRGPDVVNGDGDRTGFSVVEVGVDQELAQADQRGFYARRLREPDLGERPGLTLLTPPEIGGGTAVATIVTPKALCRSPIRIRGDFGH